VERRKLVGMLGAGVVAVFMVAGRGWSPPAWAGESADAEAIKQAKALSRAFRVAARKVIPTVVEVRTKTKPKPRPKLRRENPFRGTPFEDLFDEEFWSFEQLPQMPQPGLGSGVIIDPAGMVLTNYHVIKGADEVSVQLHDGRQFEVVDIKADERTDLAVLKLDARGSLPAAKLGDSDQLEIGDWVIAVGNPFELESTVSAGIISAKGRALGAVERARFLQTDAAINPGNSGGPLVNLEGEVVGINTAIASRTGAYQGIGFAIPVNIVKWVVPQLIRSGVVRRSYLGVGIMKITAERSEQLGVLPQQGVVVEEVFPDTPAEEAGLEVDDVILRFDNRPIRSPSDLQQVVERCEPDTRHKMDILRDRKPMALTVVVKAMPEEYGTAARGPRGEFYQDRRLGLVVIELTPTMADQLGFGERAGALVIHVDRERIAYRAGLREGMLVLQVNQTPIGSVEDFRRAMEKASLQEGITLQVRTSRGVRTITLKAN